jgi:hypothetical protein
VILSLPEQRDEGNQVFGVHLLSTNENGTRPVEFIDHGTPTRLVRRAEMDVMDLGTEIGVCT